MTPLLSNRKIELTELHSHDITKAQADLWRNRIIAAFLVLKEIEIRNEERKDRSEH